MVNNNRTKDCISSQSIGTIKRTATYDDEILILAWDRHKITTSLTLLTKVHDPLPNTARVSKYLSLLDPGDYTGHSIITYIQKFRFHYWDLAMI